MEEMIISVGNYFAFRVFDFASLLIIGIVRIEVIQIESGINKVVEVTTLHLTYVFSVVIKQHRISTRRITSWAHIVELVKSGHLVPHLACVDTRLFVVKDNTPEKLKPRTNHRSSTTSTVEDLVCETIAKADFIVVEEASFDIALLHLVI